VMNRPGPRTRPFTSRAQPVSRGSHRRDSRIGYVVRGANHSLYRSTGSRSGDRTDRAALAIERTGPLCVRVPDAARYRRPGRGKGKGG
jgi:hypothetical protein